MLRESDRVWIEVLRHRHEKGGTGASRAKDKRIRDKARTSLADLAYLAERLPEGQAAQIFTSELLSSLLRAILGPGHKVTRDIERQLSLAEIAIQTGAELWARPGVRDDMQMIREMGAHDLTLKHAREVLVQAALNRACRAWKETRKKAP